MIKRTLYFGNPAYLSLKLNQLVINFPDSTPAKTIPIEDIGILILDNWQITVTHGALEEMLENNVAVITCDKRKMPSGLLLPLNGNSIQNERFRNQVDSSIPLKKQLWQQTVQSKIANQAALLTSWLGVETGNMKRWVTEVKSGDSSNLEARAAVYYWSNLFPHIPGFRRDRDGVPPNDLLNYGYAILCAVVARSLVGSGLLPTLGIHHHNRYNAYCLADDIMEPYRPFVDRLVCEIIGTNLEIPMLSIETKKKLLTIPTIDVVINNERSPLMVAVSQTTSSLFKCFKGEQRRITYPVLK